VGIVASISALGVWRLTSPTHFETGVAEVREIRLTDGSEVTLGACTSIDVAFRGDERRVTLNEGEVFFSVSRSLTRPFVVMIGNKEVRVLGTKFEVRRRATTIRLAVAEGKVEVIEVLAHSPTVPVTTLPGSAQLLSETTHPATVHRSDRASSTPQDAQAGAPPEDHLLTSGQQVTVALNGPIPEPEPMPLRDLAAWRHGRLVYVDAPLREVVADANRYSHESIVIGDERVADLRVSVTYPSNRVDEMLSALSRSLSIEIGRPAPGEIVLQYKGRKD
jgi:transmembrane sensor